eukprot:scaffold2240_cov75-Phaeocystis_antarctica.AAC.1
MHITTFPTLPPLCSSRKAASHLRARSKVCVGSPCSTPASARCESFCSTRCIHGGSCCMSLSIASTSYRRVTLDCRIRTALHTLRLPISSKAPPSPSSAADAEMKSSDRLLSTTAKRPAQSARAAPRANAAPPRDELNEIALGPPRTAPSSFTSRCLYGWPAVAWTTAPSQCAYSTATSPTPPAVVCTSVACPWYSCAPPSAAVHAASKESAAGLGTSNAEGPRATLARQATLNPSTAVPVRRWAEPRPACRTTPAQSPPGGPGSPGYSPSTLITSRKLRPTARTCVSEAWVDEKGGGVSEHECAPRARSPSHRPGRQTPAGLQASSWQLRRGTAAVAVSGRDAPMAAARGVAPAHAPARRTGPPPARQRRPTH